MHVGVAIDGSEGLDWDEQRQLARDAVELGVRSMWTPGFGGHDPFQRCGQWHFATLGHVPGLAVGVSVVSAPLWHPLPLAVAAAALSDMTNGRFLLGLGPSAISSTSYRRMMGVSYHHPLTLMREYVCVLRQLLSGEPVNFHGEAIDLEGAALGFTPAPVPIHLGGMAENLLRLAGEIADGASLNWCSPERVRWSRDRVDEGARAAGREPSSIILSSHIRVCVDEDPEVARLALAEAVSHYAIADPGESKTTSYRGQFARMGFDDVLTELEARRDMGESVKRICASIPTEMLDEVGCYGTPEDIAPKFARFARGVDIPIIRVVVPRPGLASVRSVVRSCRPEIVEPLMDRTDE